MANLIKCIHFVKEFLTSQDVEFYKNNFIITDHLVQ